MKKEYEDIYSIIFKSLMSGEYDDWHFKSVGHGNTVFEPKDDSKWVLVPDRANFFFVEQTPYWDLMKILHAIWTNKNTPIIKRIEKLKTAYKKYVEKKEKRKGDKNIKPFLPAPPGTTWKEVTFKITKDAKMEISIKGCSKIYDLTKLHEIGLPEYLYKLLVNIIWLKVFNKNNFEDKNHLKQNISMLRKKLKKIFQINDDPIIYNYKKGVYIAEFNIKINYGKDEDRLNDEQLDPEDNTPQGIRKTTYSKPAF